MSDECFAGGGIGDGVGNLMLDEFDKDRSPADVNMYETQWKSSYKALYRCNMLISKLDQVNWKSTEARNKVEAEVRFIRAYIYFEMVKLWGNIPLVTTPLKPEEANIPQANPDDVYKLIESDLLFAAENAQLSGAQWTPEWANTNDGHATVFAAKSLLARVFLFYTGYYNKTALPGGTSKEQVTTQLTDVYASGHGLVAAYKNLWPGACSVRDASATPIGLTTTYAGEGNKETVWAIKFNSTGAWGTNDGIFRNASYWFAKRPGSIIRKHLLWRWIMGLHAGKWRIRNQLESRRANRPTYQFLHHEL
ncbi:MAG: RagB/SusD family nutrient uptake outer membrane protein [Paludibacter sp.]